MSLVNGKRRMARGKRSNKGGVKAPVTSAVSTSIAAAVSGTVGRTRKGRDKVTRVTSPIKVADTNARQWNRYGP